MDFVKKLDAQIRQMEGIGAKNMKRRIIKHKEKNILKNDGKSRESNSKKCNKPMVNAYDSILKKISIYMWQTTCGHDENLRLIKG